MPRILCVEINNFRGIKKLSWNPRPGINCLVGPGDSGKTTVLDAIDLCLSARRNIEFSDADFNKLDISSPITIQLTIGSLDDELKSLDSYGLYLRGFDEKNGKILDEPENGKEIALTVQLIVQDDLEPTWTLFSERAAGQGQTRHLSWADRLKLSPVRIGAFSNYDLSWRKGSILSRIAPEKIDTSEVVVKVGRDARLAYGKQANTHLASARAIAVKTAQELGIEVGKEVNAMLDADSFSLNGIAISLHSEAGIPLSSLGVGSTRLLVAGLQKQAGVNAKILLVDELEYGLEPHRLIRFIGSLGAKEATPPFQVFVTTHSPVAVRELSGDQISIIKKGEGNHEVLPAGIIGDVQGAIRRFPEAILAPSIVVCEGATEVGFLRGLDLYWSSQGKQSIMACGVALVDSNGIGDVYKRALAFQKLKGRVSVLRDDDAKPKEGDEKDFVAKGGSVFMWSPNFAIEDEIFQSLSAEAIKKMIQLAVDFWKKKTIDDHLKSASEGKVSLDDCLNSFVEGHRAIIAKAAKSSDWYKSVGIMEEATRNIIAGDYNASKEFVEKIEKIYKWTHGAS